MIARELSYSECRALVMADQKYKAKLVVHIWRRKEAPPV